MRKLREHVEEARIPASHMKEIKFYLSGVTDQSI